MLRVSERICGLLRRTFLPGGSIIVVRHGSAVVAAQDDGIAMASQAVLLMLR